MNYSTSSSSTSILTKIGPGLGSRQRIWERVQAKIFSDAYPYTTWQPNHHLPNTDTPSRYPLTLNNTASTIQQLPPTTPIASSFIPMIPEKERRLLQNLANSLNLPTHSSGSKSSNNSNSAWLEFIPIELIDIYYAIYDEMKVLPISEKEIMKIDKDVPRTFGLFARHARHLRLNFPSDMSAYYDALKSILCAISYERGYCQGINFIVAAMLIQYPHEKQVYTILSYLLKYQYVGILFDPRYSSLLDYMRLFEKKLRKHNRNVYNHFKKCDFTTVSYAIEWFTTCFIVSSPGELSLCVLDLLIAGFDNIMIRVGLALLDFLEEKILQLDFEGLHQKFKFLMTNADPIVIMANAIKMKLDTDVNYLQVMSQKIESMDPSQGGNLQFSRRTAISGRRHSEILISPIKIEGDDDDALEQKDNEQNGSSEISDFSWLADDESSPPTVHKLMRMRALKKKGSSYVEAPKMQLIRSARRNVPNTTTKIKLSFSNQPTILLSPNERLLPNSPNLPTTNGEAYTYNVPITPLASPVHSNQFNLTSDPAMYQTTNVAQNWWNANSWRTSLINSFKGVSKLFQPTAPDAALVNNMPAVSDLDLQSAVVIGSGSAFATTPSTPPRQGNGEFVSLVPSNATVQKIKIDEDDFDLDNAIILSDSDFSSDVSESKHARRRKHKKRHDSHHHGYPHFRNRKLITFLYDNLYNSISNNAASNIMNTNGGAEKSAINGILKSEYDKCVQCCCGDDMNYFGDVDVVSHHCEADADQYIHGSNIRIIREPISSESLRSAGSAIKTEPIDTAGDEVEGGENGYLGNKAIAMVFAHHLHESWFNPDGKKISKANLKLRHFHCSKLSLLEVARKLVKGNIQVCEEDFVVI